MATPPPDEDVRRVPPAWGELVELVEGARRRGWSDDQVAYLEAALGVCWAKATHRARAACAGEERR